MPQDLALEIQVIRRFITKNKQERYIQFVSSPRNRPKFINDLSRRNVFDESLWSPVKGIERLVIEQALQLSNISAQSCYVISEDRALDTLTLPLALAVRETVGAGLGSILVFGAADLLFIELETMNHRYLATPRP